ncbi:acyltransferase [Nocardia sp. BMG51109]|uniref:acyltransferase family protein n=1 Tax=Nocardia sp. BMG51109 TaxID=1056816 RepID=UPI0004655C03|nr:acyltransferase [Nocardia sp. BMG51109]
MFETTTKARPEKSGTAEVVQAANLDSLTGLRGLSALLVFVFHFTTFQLAFDGAGKLAFATIDRPRFLDMSGNFAVSSFFILSGFVLTWSTRPDTSLANFYAKRIGKLYPVYLVTSLAAGAAIVLLGMPLSGWNVLTHLTLTQSWVPWQEIYMGLNPVTWSLSTELFFYLLFPIALLALRRASTGVIWLVSGVTVALAFLTPFYVRAFIDVAGADAHIRFFSTGHIGGEATFWFTMAFPPYRFLEFLLGICAAVLILRGRMPRIRSAAAWTIVVACYALGTLAPGPLQRAAAGLVPLTLLVIALAQADLGAKPSFLRSRIMVWLGKLSYGMYAVQLLIFMPTCPFLLKAVSRWLEIPLADTYEPIIRIPVMLFYFVVVVAVSVPIYKLVEVPAYDYAKKLFRNRPSAACFDGVSGQGK